jgi:hypothetical protein
MEMKITLGKSEKINVYRSESDILLDGHWVGTVEIKYGYTQQDKLRIKEYCVSVHKTWVWETIIRATTRSCYGRDTVTQSFRVDGTWETKGSKCPPQIRVYGIPVGFDFFTNGYTSARAAKAAAMAFITDEIKVGIFQ